MRNIVVSVVTVMMCVMMVHARVKPQKDFDLQKFLGKWYRVGLAYDSPYFVPFRDKIKISMGTISALPNAKVNLTMWEAIHTTCKPQFYTYNQTNVPGEFTYFSTRHNIVKDITVVDTDYTEYALVIKYKEFNIEYTQVALYGRAPRVRVPIIQKFKALALSQGFPTESIITPPPAENCPQSTSGS